MKDFIARNMGAFIVLIFMTTISLSTWIIPFEPKVDPEIHILDLPVGTIFVMKTSSERYVDINSCMLLEKNEITNKALYKCRGEQSVWSSSLVLKKTPNKVTTPNDSDYWRWGKHHSNRILIEYASERGGITKTNSILYKN